MLMKQKCAQWLLVTLLLLGALPLWAQNGVRLSMTFRNEPLPSVLLRLEQSSSYKFLFTYEDVSEYRVSGTVKDASFFQIVDFVLRDKPLHYTVNGKFVNIVPNSKASAPQSQSDAGKMQSYGGYVYDAQTREPIVGAQVHVIGTTVRAVTDLNGAWSFSHMVTSGHKVEVTYVGMKKKVLSLQRNMKIYLDEDVNNIDDVVVTGIFQRKKEGFTGSATKMDGDELRKLSSGNVLNAIGMLDPSFRMGDNIMSGSNPNSVPNITMRGQASMGDYSTDETVIMRGDIDTRPNQPLFVLDGIIGVSVTKIIDLDPEQIGSITLLKDAAAMAIYGSQASNGVVIVETKAPQPGKLRVTYNGSYKLEWPDLSDYHLLNAAQKLEIEKRAGYYDPIGDDSNIVNRYNSYRWKLLEVERGVNTYWLSQPVRTVFNHRHGVTLEGGDESLRYKLYAGINQAPGIMKGTGVYGKSASLDIRYRYKGILISNIAYVDYTKSDRTSPYGDFSTYTKLNPYYRIYDSDGNILRYLEQATSSGSYTTSAGMTVGNPMYDTQFNSKDTDKNFSIRDAFRVEYRPIQPLMFAMDFNITKISDDVDVFKSANNSNFVTISDINQKGSYQWSHSDQTSYELAFTASYNKVFKQKHVLSLYGRYSISESNYHLTGIYQTGFPNDNMDEVYLGAKNGYVSGNESKTRAFGGVGTASYTYDQRYAVDANVRVDASSQFGKNNRYAPFWSTGVRWNADKEKFIKNLHFFDELVLRLTYGVTGTQTFSSYQALQMYNYANTMRTYQSSDVVGTLLYGLGNPDLKWQKTNAFNIGFDFNMWHRIISGRFEYYDRLTKNTLIDYSLPPSVGFTTVKDNLGNISNRGYEVTLRVMPYNNLNKQLNFNVVFNGSHNKNTIKKVSNALKMRNEAQLQEDPNNPNKLSRPMPRYVEGYSQTMIWAVRSLGIDPITGREIFLTQDGKRTSVWNSADMVPVGDTEPDLMGTIGLNANWRGLSLTVASGYRFGGQYYNSTLVDKVENANLSYNVDIRAYTDRWLQPGDVVKYKAVTQDVNGSQTKASSRFVMDRNELVLNTITLQYRFERKREKFLKHLGLSSATVGLYMEDLFHWSTIKQERGITYPMSRQVTMNMSLTF